MQNKKLAMLEQIQKEPKSHPKPRIDLRKERVNPTRRKNK